MMLRLLVVAALLGLVGLASAAPAPYAGHSVVRLTAAQPQVFLKTVQLLHSAPYDAQVDVWRARYPLIDVQLPADARTKANLLDLVTGFNVSVESWIPDLQGLIDEVEAENAAHAAADANDFFRDYRRVSQIRDYTVELCAAHPACTFIPSIGKTVQGNDIFAVAIGGRANGPAFYFQSLLHAREHASGSTGMWILKELLTGRDPAVEDWLSRMRVVYVPVANIDGYEFSHTSTRLWRKNRQAPPAGSTCIGIDLNRNFGEHWGGGGSSSNPCSDTYRGARAFEAPETRAVEVLLTETLPSQGYRVVGGLDIHCYGQLILRPYGWALPRDATPPNNAELRALGDRMRDAIRAKHGVSYTSEHAAELYVAAGGADDWFYAVASKGKLGFTFELRDTGRFGFLLPAAQIVPTGEEVWEAFKVMLKHVVENN